MSYYDFSKHTSAARRPQRSKPGLLVAVIVAALIWGGLHLLGGKNSPSQASIAQTTIVSLPETDQPAAVETTTPADTSSAPQFHSLTESHVQANQPKAISGHNIYNLQVAASPSGTAAAELVQTLKSHDFPAHLVTNPTSGKKSWNQVVIGPFNSSSSAYLVQKKLQKLGFRGVLLISKQPV